jgi:hypothetical protein
MIRGDRVAACEVEREEDGRIGGEYQPSRRVVTAKEFATIGRVVGVAAALRERVDAASPTCAYRTEMVWKGRRFGIPTAPPSEELVSTETFR